MEFILFIVLACAALSAAMTAKEAHDIQMRCDQLCEHQPRAKKQFCRIECNRAGKQRAMDTTRGKHAPVKPPKRAELRKTGMKRDAILRTPRHKAFIERKTGFMMINGKKKVIKMP